MSGLTDKARRLGRNLWSEEGSVGQKAVRSAVWVTASAGTTQGLAMVRTVILVRLLVPEDFGIMRVAGFLLAAMGVFTRTGMGQAIVQRKDVDEATLNTAWTIGVIRGVGLFAATFAVAPWVARFYENPLISPILRVIAFKFLIGAFANIGVTLLRKELSFRKHEMYEAATNFLGIAFTVAMAFWLRSVWALAFGHLGFALLGLIGSYMVHPYRPKLALHAEKAWPLIHFGKHLLASGIVMFLKTQLDDAIVGKMLGMEALGFYALAYRLSNLPARWITSTIGAVTFPAYSKLQDDRKRLGQAFLRVLRLNTALVMPAAAGLFVLAPDIVRVVYGEAYMPMVSAFRALCLFGLLRSLAATTDSVFTAVGKPHIVTVLVTANLCIMLALIYPLTKAYGIAGTAWATVVPNLMLWPLNFGLVSHLTKLPGRQMLRVVAAPVFSSSAMVGLISVVRVSVEGVHAAALVGLVLAGAVFYFGLLFPISGESRRSILDIAGKVLSTPRASNGGDSDGQ